MTASPCYCLVRRFASSDKTGHVKLNADTLAAQLDRQLLAVYLITGDEPLLIDEAADAVRAAAARAGFAERERHTVQAGFDWQALQASTDHLSLFARQRLIEVRMPSAKPGDKGAAAIRELVAGLGEDCRLLLIAPRFDNRVINAKWVKVCEQAGALVQIRPIPPGRFGAWLTARMRQVELEPTPGAVALIAERVEGNLLAAQQEVEKLRILLGPGGVDEAGVVGAVADSARYDVFQLADAALAGRVARAVRILEGLRSEGVAPSLVLWALSKDIRALVQAASGPQADAARLRQPGVWESRLRLLQAAFQRHTLEQLFALIRQAAHADRVIKGLRSGLPWDELARLVVGLCRDPHPA